jgi:hypothetical protein
MVRLALNVSVWSDYFHLGNSRFFSFFYVGNFLIFAVIIFGLCL